MEPNLIATSHKTYFCTFPAEMDSSIYILSYNDMIALFYCDPYNTDNWTEETRIGFYVDHCPACGQRHRVGQLKIANPMDLSHF